MSDQDLFEQDANSNAGDPGQSQADPFVDKLSMIKNENGEPKYKDVETALEALAASQQFIETLKTEKHEQEQKLTEAMGKLQEMGSIDDFVKRLQPNAAQPPKETTEDKGEGFSEEKIAQLLEQKLSERTQVERQEANLNQVLSRLSEIYGDKAAAAIQAKAKELNTTPAELKKLSQTNPAMALSLLGGVAPSSSSSPSVPSQISRTAAQEPDPAPRVEVGKGIARGGYSNRELAEMFRKSKERTNKRLNIES